MAGTRAEPLFAVVAAVQRLLAVAATLGGRSLRRIFHEFPEQKDEQSRDSG